tara:strand:+ start:293 stop:490 length:198 start_codon:yes stop_codon:yes gene_type:complete
MTFFPEVSLGDLVNAVAYYRDQVNCSGIFIDECKYGTHFKILTNDGEIREFDTVYYYLEALKEDD